MPHSERPHWSAWIPPSAPRTRSTPQRNQITTVEKRHRYAKKQETAFLAP